VSDYGDLLEVVVRDVLMELFDDRIEDGAGCIGTGWLAGEACELDEVETIRGGEELCFRGVDVTRTGKAGDKDDVGAFAWRDALDDDSEACGRRGDGLAEDGLSQQQDAGEEKENGDKAESSARCGHGLAPWNYFSVPDGLRFC
jgi:hypothetical protein